MRKLSRNKRFEFECVKEIEKSENCGCVLCAAVRFKVCCVNGLAL